MEAYSMIVTGASFEPSIMSPSELGLATAPSSCAAAEEISFQGDRPAAIAAPVKAKAALKVRRVIIAGNSGLARAERARKKVCKLETAIVAMRGASRPIGRR